MENPFEIINERLDRIENLLEKICTKIEDGDINHAYSKIIDINQLSTYLNISKSHIYKLTASNNIPHSKRGKKLYFKKENIDIWVLENKIISKEELSRKAMKHSLKKQ